MIHSLTGTVNINSNECNQCHGPSALGHISYSIALSMPQLISNGTSNVLSAIISNNNYPLSQASISLQQSSDFHVNAVGSSNAFSKSLGLLGRGSTTTASWNITPIVQSNKTISFHVNFQATAINHTTFTYTNAMTKSVFVSTAPVIKTGILQVLSNPAPDSSFLVGQQVGNTSIIIQNTGQAVMKDVVVNTTGHVLVNDKSNFTIPSIAPNSKVSYPIQLDTSQKGNSSIMVTYEGSKPTQTYMILILVNPVPPPSPILLIGAILGYITYIMLFASVIAGVGVFHLRKILSGRKIRILHSDLSNLSFTLAIVHGVILSLPSSPWFGTYSWFNLLPEVTTTFSSTGDLGLEIGRWTLVIMYIGVISGYFIAQIIKTFGRKVGISIHMLTYLTLILGLVHAMLLGTFAKAYIVIPIIMFISIISVGLLKYEIKWQMARKKAQRAKRNQAQSKNKLTAVSTHSNQPTERTTTNQPGTQPTQHKTTNNTSASQAQRSMITGKRIRCKKCKTMNDDDSVYCKKCGAPMT